MVSDAKYKKRKVIQACGSGDLKSLKKYYELDYLDHWIMKDAIYYCIRACHIECVEFLIEISNITLVDMDVRSSLTWNIINRKGTDQSKRILMFRFLYENGLTHVPKSVVNVYLNKSNKKYLKGAILEFSNEIDLVKLLEEEEEKSRTTLSSKSGLLSVIYQEIRTQKIDSIL